MMQSKVVLLDPTTAARAEQLRRFVPEGFIFSHGTQRGDAHMAEIIADADFAITGQVPVSGFVLQAAKKLRLLHKWGVGIDNIDVEAARKLGIVVARTTGGNAEPVAEFTIGLMIATLRQIAYGHAELLKGEWRTGQLPRESLMLTGKTVGIIGFGAIGLTLAALLQGFRCKVLYYKRNRLSLDDEQARNVAFAPLHELLAQSDVVSLNCPLTDDTRNLIDRAAFGRMKKSAILVNVARGGVVHESDLVEALQQRIIAAAAMDVYETEPLPPDSPLLRLENIVVTPHLASMAADNVPKMMARMFANMQRILDGQDVPAMDRVV